MPKSVPIAENRFFLPLSFAGVLDVDARCNLFRILLDVLLAGLSFSADLESRGMFCRMESTCEDGAGDPSSLGPLSLDFSPFFERKRLFLFVFLGTSVELLAGVTKVWS